MDVNNVTQVTGKSKNLQYLYTAHPQYIKATSDNALASILTETFIGIYISDVKKFDGVTHTNTWLRAIDEQQGNELNHIPWRGTVLSVSFVDSVFINDKLLCDLYSVIC